MKVHEGVRAAYEQIAILDLPTFTGCSWQSVRGVRAAYEHNSPKRTSVRPPIGAYSSYGHLFFGGH